MPGPVSPHIPLSRSQPRTMHPAGNQPEVLAQCNQPVTQGEGTSGVPITP